MKKQIFTIILLLMGGVSTFGQSFKLDATGANDMRLRTSATDRLNILNNGNVGIGTATPDSKLDINGDISFSKITRFTTNGGYSATNRNGASVLIFEAGGALNGIAGGVDGMLLYVFCGYKLPTTTTTGALIIKHEESVSETVPANRIMTHTGVDFNIPTGTGGVMMMYDGGRQRWRIMEANIGWGLAGNTATNPATDFIGTTDAQPLVVKTNNVEAMRVLSTGSVGIGTTTPDSRLHVVNGSAGSVNAFSNTVATLENSTDAFLSILTPNFSNGGICFGSPYLNKRGYLIYLNLPDTMIFGTGGGTQMLIDGFGNVGIGSSFTPQARLDINGDIKLGIISIAPATTSTIDPLDRQNKSYCSINPSAGITVSVNGITAPLHPTSSFGTMLYITCGAGANVILKNNASAVPANNIQTPTGTDITLSGRAGVTLAYDVDGWRVISVAN